MMKLRLSVLGYLPAIAFLASFLLVCNASAQVLSPDQEVQVHDLPSLMARTPHSSDVLLTSLDTIIHEREVCCGKDSALEDSVERADPKSLKDVASKIEGRHLLSDGRPIKVNTVFLTVDQVNAFLLVSRMQKQQAALIQWNSRIYVLYGLDYLWTENYNPESGDIPLTTVHKFLLWDTRYSDARRQVVFNRETDDPGTIQGFLFVDFKLQ